MREVYQSVMHWAASLNQTEWIMLLGAAFVVGILTLRGFGSRSTY